ncbi:CapA family protein [Gracilibacillus caseinilyticus]|uniref:CapA family protein n=2 Tax=Gracilibacillus caseinilyticus TaxID=2932256 RepID=A0ABY4F1S5_9BACI|nr:CapA family protein [Gracilibacillus caseinilyticus]
MIATGDSFIARRIPENDQRAKSIKDWISGADVRFTNLEITTHQKEGYPSPFSGGTWAMAEPSVLDDLKYYGFNLYNWATNHTMDYLQGGLLATERELDARGLIHAGAGRTLAAAAEPRYVDTVQGRVALIGATSTFYEASLAGDPTPHIKGRPGINPLRYEEVYYVTKSEMATLKQISSNTHIDANEMLNRLEGFSVEGGQDELLFSGKLFKIADRSHRVRRPLKKDIERLTASIQAARRQADYVIVSIHSHEMEGMDKNTPADFLRDAARVCIDAGAHTIFGHGPHVVRGIELYQGRPIFYSLGNFIFQNDSVSYLPSDFYQKYGLRTDANVADGYDVRSDFGKKGLGVNPYVWESIIAKLAWDGDDLESIELQPIKLGFEQARYQRGWPELSDNVEVLQRIKELSRSFGTEIVVEGKKAMVVCK